MTATNSRVRLFLLFREGIWVLFGQIMAVIGSLVGVRLLTELLEPSVYGQLALGMTIATLINQTIFGPLSNGAIRLYAPSIECNDLSSYLQAVRRLAILGTVIVILLTFTSTIVLVFSDYKQWLSLAIASLIFATLSGYNSILNGIQNAARQRSIVALHQGMISWAKFLFAAGVILIFGVSSAAAMLGYALATLLVLGFQAFFVNKLERRKGSVQDDISLWRANILNYSWPFSVWGVFYWAHTASDRWALGVLTTTQEVGLFAVLFQLGYYPISLSIEVGMQFLSPILFQHAGDAHDVLRNARLIRIIWYISGAVLVFTVFIFVITSVFHTQIFSLFTAKKYGVVSHLMPWMILSGGIFACGQIMSLNLMSLLKTRSLLPVKVVTALLGILFNFAGVYYYGLAGIACAALFFSFIYFFWMVILSVKLYTTVRVA